jgi:dolichol kinase
MLTWIKAFPGWKMNNVLLHRFARKTVHWLLVTVILLYIVTGYGITHYQIVEPATLGLLGKLWAFKIHDNLMIPFVVLLALHIYQIAVRRSQ